MKRKGGIFMKLKKSIKQMAKDFQRTRRPVKVKKGKHIGYLKKENNSNGSHLDMLVGTRIIGEEEMPL